MIGQAIQHNTYGNGIVTSVQGNVISVRFVEEEKRFIYPDAFKQYLKLKDAKAQKRINNLISRREQAAEEQFKADLEKQERLQKIRNFKIAVNSQAAFNLSESDRDEVFSDWTLSTGCYLSGTSRGEPRVPDKMGPNSACLLTERPDGIPEAERKIIGAFMVKEDFLGDECTDGRIEAHEEFRIELDEQSALPFWGYFAGKENPRWGNAALKYFSNRVMKNILSDMMEALPDKGAKKAAEKFYRYYCKINRLWSRSDE